MQHVALLVSKCTECGFENPRRWVSCARCGHLLGPSLGHTATRHMSTITRNPADPKPAPADAAPHELDDKTQLSDTFAMTADARPLVGQDVAIQTLRQQLELTFAQRRVTLTFIQGGAGTGRTRLLERAGEIAARGWTNARVVYCACRSSDDGPYAPFSRYLLERFGITPASSPSQVRADMLSEVADALIESNTDEIREVTHLLGHVAAVPFPASAILASLANAPDELRERASHALLRLIEADARPRPLLLLLDDMQRADVEGFQVLERLLSAATPIAIVVSGDESIAPHLAKLAPLVPSAVAPIRPLGEAEVSELVMALVPGLRATPESFVTALCHRCQGNPSTLRELVRALDDRGLFLRSGEGIEIDLRRFERGDSPLTLHDAVRARLAALPAYERMVMQWAAVVGELFWEGALLALARAERPAGGPAIDPILRWTQAADEPQLSAALDQLEAKGFIVSLAEAALPGLREFTFPVAGTRGIIYAELPEQTCTQRHAVVARWMSLATRLEKEGWAATLGQHLERAGLHAQASRAFLTAAREESARLRTTMALRYAQKALALATEHQISERVEALHETGSLLTMLGRYDAAAKAFAEIVELAWQVGARGVGGAALNRLARIHRQRGEHKSALEYLHRALLLFQSALDERGIASTYDDMAQVHRSLGDLAPALEAAQQALQARRSMHDGRGEAVSLTTLGFIELDRGNLALARTHFEAARTVRRSGADAEGALHTEIGLGKLAQHEGRPELALAHFEPALDRAREMNHRRLQSTLLTCQAEAQLALGGDELAQRSLLEARSLASHLHDQKALAEIELNLGLVALARHDPNAEQQLAAALRFSREHGTREAIALAHRGLARARARTLYDTALPREAKVEDVASDAEASFRESIRIFEESGNLREAACTRAELGYHLVERGAGARARAALGEAYAALKPLALPDLARVTETLEQL